MAELALRPASAFGDEELAELLTASYEGYLVPFAMDADAFRFLTRIYDLDRDASRVALRDGRPVGIANLGLRGADAWVGGIGVVPEERRRGIARMLMHALHDEARSRGVERVWLEVIVENVQAHALYVDLGYEHVRDVEVWSLARAEGVAAVVPADEAGTWIGSHRAGREPWQRDDASLAKLDGIRGLAVDGAAALVRVTGDRVGIVQLAGETGALVSLLAGARSLGDLTILNLPDDHPAAAAFAELGGRVAVRQHELVLTL